MNRVARLQSAIGWLQRFEGSNVVRSYARWFGVDLGCALRELRILDVELDPVYVSRLETTLRNRPPRPTRPAVPTESADDLELFLEDLTEPDFWEDRLVGRDEIPF